MLVDCVDVVAFCAPQIDLLEQVRAPFGEVERTGVRGETLARRDTAARRRGGRHGHDEPRSSKTRGMRFSHDAEGVSARRTRRHRAADGGRRAAGTGHRASDVGRWRGRAGAVIFVVLRREERGTHFRATAREHFEGEDC